MPYKSIFIDSPEPENKISWIESGSCMLLIFSGFENLRKQL